MITVFTTPKRFKSNVGVTQRNAIENWKRLRFEVIVFGGSKKIIEDELGVRRVTKFAKNEFGTPLANDLFTQAQELARNDVLMYSNCDMLYLANIVPAVYYIRKRFESFLIVGQRWDVAIEERLDIKRLDYEGHLQTLINARGSLHSVSGKDFFIFRKPFDMELPPLILGRVGWDNYLIHYAADHQMDVIDVTPVVTAIHQNHDYSHLTGGKQEFLHGSEKQRNYELAPVPTDKGRISEAHWQLIKKDNYLYQVTKNERKNDEYHTSNSWGS